MPTYSIPPAQWRAALDRFSLAHHGWPVTIEVLSPTMGAQPEVLELPLAGLSVGAPGEDPAIAVSMARQALDHITHLVEHVREIHVAREAGEDNGLEVVSSDGTRTLLRFSRPEGARRPA